MADETPMYEGEPNTELPRNFVTDTCDETDAL